MQIQLAIDRVSIEQASKIIDETKDYIDIIEIGTSLIKDYGMESVRKIREAFPDITILADIKTIDEAEYEFRAVYEAGADIATVMGAASLSTIRHCQRAAGEYNKRYMIDLLEVNEDKIQKLKEFMDGIFCVHLASDDRGAGLEGLVKYSVNQLNPVSRIAVAGGVTLELLPMLMDCEIEIAVVGGAVTKAENIKDAARAFSEYIRFGRA